MSLLKSIGRNRRRAKAKYSDMIRAMDPDGVYILVNRFGRQKIMTGAAWKEGFKELG